MHNHLFLVLVLVTLFVLALVFCSDSCFCHPWTNVFDVMGWILDSLLAKRFAALCLEVVLFLRTFGCDWPRFCLTHDSLSWGCRVGVRPKHVEEIFVRPISRRILFGARHS